MSDSVDAGCPSCWGALPLIGSTVWSTGVTGPGSVVLSDTESGIGAVASGLLGSSNELA